MIKLEISGNEGNQRLDKFLRKYLANAPLSYIFKAVRKDVRVNGKRKKNDYMLAEGDVLCLYISDEDHEKFRKKTVKRRAKKQFSVVYEDDHIMIVSKPSGLLTHGDKKEKKNHLTNQVIDYLIGKGEYNPQVEKTFVPAPVNRLDRNTSGLVIFCKDYRSLQAFNRMIRERGMIRKFYRTAVIGELAGPLELSGRMVRDELRNITSVTDEDGEGRLMMTKVIPLKTVYPNKPGPGKRKNRSGGYAGFPDALTLAEVEIETGRTHQIRAQLAAAGCPIVGDMKYGERDVNRKFEEEYGLKGQFLHAERLEFSGLPEDFEYLNGTKITAPLPKVMAAIQKDLF